MLRSSHGFFLIVFSLMLASCAGVDEKIQDFHLPAESTALQKFPAWSENNFSANINAAVQELLQQADALIAENKIEQASEKLERSLRIEPTAAQAWSRLAWVALNDQNPKRAEQMAQRSNSYASGSKQLKKLNWMFIREAGLQMRDDKLVVKAESVIETLNRSMGEN